MHPGEPVTEGHEGLICGDLPAVRASIMQATPAGGGVQEPITRPRPCRPLAHPYRVDVFSFDRDDLLCDLIRLPLACDESESRHSFLGGCLDRVPTLTPTSAFSGIRALGV